MDKKVKAGSVAIGICLLVIAVLLFGIVYFFYNANIEKNNLQAKINELETTIKEKDNKVNELENKISKVSDVVNDEDKTTNDSVKNEKNNVKTFSNDEIKKSIQNYLDLTGAYIGAPNALLNKLGFENYDENEVTEDYYQKTNIKYEEYKNKMLNYVTEKWFDSNFQKHFKSVDGYLYYFNGGATGMSFEVKTITLKGDYSKFNYIADVYNVHIDESKESENIEFHIEEQNEKCVISYCDY